MKRKLCLVILLALALLLAWVFTGGRSLAHNSPILCEGENPEPAGGESGLGKLDESGSGDNPEPGGDPPPPSDEQKKGDYTFLSPVFPKDDSELPLIKIERSIYVSD